ncbi:anti-sigma factor [Agreia pratensis]|uniref:Regulator of SigK n=1 Tax=Agreia pratensis TaxID=150121 RepID=A0A1X7JTH6_9MICO|nr:anti-sigma factor [Agreia pratensis]MBF4635519.1 anti-sigma factor [Agreia pratensis]SMG31682.1 Anti-sigma-K factor rskA [Agreia pratensis]
MATNDDSRMNTGAFALGALSPDELERFIAAAESDPELAAEADGLSATAVLLGLASTPVDPSAKLKVDLMAAIASTPQLPRETVTPVVDVRDAEPSASARVEDAPPRPVEAGAAEQKARTRWFARPATLLVSAAAAIGLFVGGGFVGSALTGDTPVVVDQQAAGLAQIYAASDVQSVRSEVEGGGVATLVWSGELGRSAVVVDGLAPLPAGSVYEAWYINDAGAAPAGTFDATGAHKTSWHLLDGTMSAGDTVGVTVEPAGGSKTPTTTPIVAIASA